MSRANSRDCQKISITIPSSVLSGIEEEAERRELTRSRMIVKACEFMLQVSKGGNLL